MKKILFVIDSLNIGGAEKSLISLLNNIDYNKYKIFLLILSKNQPLIQHIPIEIEVLPVPEIILSLYKPLLSHSKNIKLLFRRLRFALQNRINRRLISTNNFLYWNCFSSLFKKLDLYYDVAIGWGQGIPIFFIIDKINAFKKIGWFNAEYPIEKKFRLQLNKYFKELTYAVAVSEVLAKKLIFTHPFLENKIKVIYDIIDSDKILSLSNEKIQFIFPEDKIKILTIGRLDKRKGFDLAIEAAQLLKKEFDFIWYIIGDGIEREALKNKINKYQLNDTFILIGELENPYPFFKFSDIYVQTSISEGFCITLAEAKIFNKPIVTTDFSTAFIQIEQGITGIISKKEPDELAQNIKILVSDKRIQERFIQNLSKEKKGNEKEILKFYSLIN